MRITLITFAICLCASFNASLNAPYVMSGTVGRQQRITRDVTERSTDEQMKKTCPWVRITEVEYELDGNDQYHTIDYRFTQCLDEEKKMTHQYVSFKAPESGEFTELPPGCMPPSPEITEPPKSECEMGYQVGQVVSQTIANIVVPKFVADDESNPILENGEYKKFVDLLEEKQKEIANTEDLEKFEEKQAKIVEEMEQLIRDFAEEKIKCFEEHLLPKQQTDIEIICANQGAHKSIEDALKHALGSTINCGHVDCDALKEAADGGEHAFASVLNIDQQGYFKNEDFEMKEGEADISGNVRLPSPDQTYFIVHSTLYNHEQLIAADGKVGAQKQCREDDKSQKFTFKRYRDQYYTITNELGEAIRVNKDGDLVSTAEIDHQNIDAYLFRLVQNIGGSVSINSAHYYQKVIYMDSSRYGVKVGLRNFDRDVNERFYLRTDCSGKYTDEAEDNGDYTLYNNDEANTVAGRNKQ